MSRVGSVVQCGLIYNSRQNYSSIRGKKRISPAQFQKKSLSCFLREDLDFFLMYLRCFHEFFSRKSNLLFLGAFTLLADEGFVNVRDHTASSNGGLNKCVQFFVSSDGQL